MQAGGGGDAHHLLHHRGGLPRDGDLARDADLSLWALRRWSNTLEYPHGG